MSSVKTNSPLPFYLPNCKCNSPAVVRVSRKPNHNQGRKFFTCEEFKCKFFQWLTVEQQWVTVEQEKKKENNLELAREAAKNVYLKNIEQAIERIRTRAPTHPGRIRGHNSPTHPGSSFCNVSVNVKSQNVEFHLKMWDNHNSSIV